MRLELAERLRCPGAHAPTPLIVVAQETHDRVLHRAIVGCAVCGLEARIASGVLTLPSGFAVRRADDGVDPTADVADVADVERLAALLHLDAPGGAILLAGGYARFGAPLASGYGVQAIALVPPAVTRGAAPAIPFTDATFRAAAVEGLPDASLADLARVIAPGGRIVAPTTVELPVGVSLLARDAREWVAASDGAGQGGVVALKRR
jgi:hypothetical protein